MKLVEIEKFWIFEPTILQLHTNHQFCRSEEPVREEDVLVLMKRTLRLQIFSWILLAFSLGSLGYNCFLIVLSAQLNVKNDELRGLNEKLGEQVKSLSLSGWDQSETTGHYYRLITNVTACQAFAECRARGGFLASIHSDEENRVANDFLRTGHYATSGIYEGVFVGAKRTGGLGVGEWVWLDGTPWNYTMWRKGEPSFAHTQENCLQLNVDLDANPAVEARWSAVSCDISFRVALCQKNNSL
ncbi:unnamed protein product, partial [Mesorhabditis belari]|uniref:C-type lectin domain-containing protein n=1 Tax=Mesorhabditis belari TaxID=2138241 RepID=A0AAF3EHE6_9BILA